MLADLYLIPESFQQNNQFTVLEIEEKAKRLAEDVHMINQHSHSNKLFVNFALLYPVIFHSTFTVEDFLCRPFEVKQLIDRDVVNALQNVFQKATNTIFTSQEIINDLLPEHDATICHGIIAFHPIANIPDHVQLVYGIESWIRFRRYFLGLYPSKETFIHECSIYFPNLFFHEHNNESVQEILTGFSKAIIKHLAVLNDIFFTYRNRIFDNEAVKYQTLTSECNLDADAASKDNNDAKEQLTFQFLDKNKQLQEVTCYPHLRICKSDSPGDHHYYQHRIYFHEGVESIHNKKILIGHIGLHRN